jgi:hypothetical protein
MSSQSQLNANRKNALKSTGPRTAEGKETSSQNATKHGLRTNRSVIKTESQEEFDIFRDNMLADLSPDGAMEEMLCERIVSLSWRLKRAEHFQNAVIDALIEHGLHGSSYGLSWSSDCTQRAQEEASSGDMNVLLGIVINKDFANSRTLEQLLVYERRIESSLYRTIAEFKKARQLKNTERQWLGHPLRETQDTEETAFPWGTPYGGALVKAKADDAAEKAHPADVLDSSVESELQNSDIRHKERNAEPETEICCCTNEANSTGSPVCRDRAGIPSSD